MSLSGLRKWRCPEKVTTGHCIEGEGPARPGGDPGFNSLHSLSLHWLEKNCPQSQPSRYNPVSQADKTACVSPLPLCRRGISSRVFLFNRIYVLHCSCRDEGATLQLFRAWQLVGGQPSVPWCVWMEKLEAVLCCYLLFVQLAEEWETVTWARRPWESPPGPRPPSGGRAGWGGRGTPPPVPTVGPITALRASSCWFQHAARYATVPPERAFPFRGSHGKLKTHPRLSHFY